MRQKGFAALSILIIIFVLSSVALIVVGKGYFQNKITLSSNNAVVRSSPSSSPSPTPPSIVPAINQTGVDANTNLILYSVNSNGFNELASFKGVDESTEYGQLQPFFDENKGIVYLGNKTNVYTYDLTSKSQQEIFSLSDKSYYIVSISIQDDWLYLNLASNDSDEGYIEEYNLTSHALRKIDPQKNVIYGSLHYLFKTINNDDVIASFGGDGCGGFGEIRLVTSSTTKVIIKTGGGCIEDPRYIGSLASSNKIVLLSVVKGWTDDNSPEQLDSLFTKDVYSGDEKVLFDFKPYINTLTNYWVDQKNNKMYLIINGELWTLNINNGQIENKVAINKNFKLENNYHVLYGSGEIYDLTEDDVSDNFNMVLTIDDTKKDLLNSYDWGKKYSGITGQSSLLGFWNNQPVVSLLVSHPANP